MESKKENSQISENQQTSSNKTKPAKPFAKYLKWLWGAFFVGLFCFAFMWFALAVGLFGKLPSVAQLENPELALATEIISADGELLGKYYRRNRSNIEFTDLSPHLINTLISTEDFRYYGHSGIDFLGLARAVFYLGSRGGASTITQQLAKNLFTNVDRSSNLKRILQKLKEWVIAIQLERRYTKEEIITMYFNTMELSDNTFGIKSAANTYFNKLPSTLNVQESATLIGMMKAPTAYNPRINPERSEKRRNIVLNQLVNYGGYNKAEADSLKALPIELDYNTIDHNEGLAPYFREYLRGWLAKWCKENKKVDGTNYDIYEDGLKVFTTIDSRMQQYAENAINEHVPERQKVFYKYFKDRKRDPWTYEKNYIEDAVKKSERYSNLKRSGKKHTEILEKFEEPIKMRLFSWEGEIDTVLSPIDSIKYSKYILHAGFMAMEPGTGHVKAWVGGINHHYYKYDNVKPTSRRQVGSTFKPFIYALAVQNGWSPCQKAPNMPVTFDKYDNYTPANASDYREGDMITLKDGLAFSMNQITAYLMKDMNPLQSEDSYKDMVNFFHQMGIQSDILPVPSICLGVADLSVFEMVGAYGTFANKGVWVEPIFISHIEDKNGNIVQEFSPKQVEALDEYSTYAMIELLRNVIISGTGRRLKREPYSFTNDLCGKTGTTQDNSDGWFMGVTPNLICGTWMGGDDKIITIKNTSVWSGASLGIPVFGKFMKQLYEDGTLGITKEDVFEAPKNYRIDINCDKFEQLDPYAQFTNPGSQLQPSRPQQPITPGQPGSTEAPAPLQTDDYYGDEFD